MKKASHKACQAIAGRTAGDLLFAMQLAHTKTKIVRDGRPWMAWSREEWARKAGLSLDQVKRALTKLQSEGLIYRERHMWLGRVAAFVSLTDKCLLLLVKGAECANGLEQKCTNHDWGRSAPTDWCKSAPIHIKEERITEREGREMADAADGDPQPSADIIPFPEGHGGPKAMATADDVAAKFRQLSPPKNWAGQIKPDKGSQLAKLWQTECAARNVKVMNVTAKQMAQLKAVAKIGGSPDYIARIVRRWDKFTTIARDDMGAFDCPNEPQIGFMLKFVDAGAKLTDEVEGVMYDPTKLEPKAKPVQPSAPAKPSKADAKKATLADLQAMLEEDGEADLLKGVA